MVPSNVLLRDLPLPELSPWAQERLTRICAFLFVVNRPEIVASALLAGYTPDIHAGGIYRASVVSGERSFGEWRQWRALRPPRDPDLPALVAELDRFVDEWQPRVMAAVAATADEGDRDELTSYLGDSVKRPSRTWQAKSWAARVEHLAKVPEPFYQAAWAALVKEGIEADLVRFHEALATVQAHIREAPLDADELSDIQAMREEGAASVQEWLDERREQFKGHVDAKTLELLALGERVPPPLPDVPLHLLASFGPTARA